MNNWAYILLIAILFLDSCDRTRNKLLYHDNGRLKAELSIKDGLRNGYCKFFYPNGNIMHEGSFRNDLKVGRHLEYFADSQALVQFEVYYEIRDGKQVPIKKIKYNRDGLAIYESNLANRKIKIEPLSTPEFVGDTLTVSVKILDPEFEYTAAFVGDFDRYLITSDTIPSRYFEGTTDHSSTISIVPMQVGLNRLKGFIRDFDIKFVNDTLGATVAFDTYFEYPYTVKKRVGI
jgi:hypothetical protein